MERHTFDYNYDMNIINESIQFEAVLDWINIKKKQPNSQFYLFAKKRKKIDDDRNEFYRSEPNYSSAVKSYNFNCGPSAEGSQIQISEIQLHVLFKSWHVSISIFGDVDLFGHPRHPKFKQKAIPYRFRI